MNDTPPLPGRSGSLVILLPAIYALLRWLAQPPMDWGWLSFVALVPLLMLVEFGHWGLVATSAAGEKTGRIRRWFQLGWQYRYVWLAAFLFWLTSLQGLRYAHPLMFIPMLALAGYLAIYSVVFVALVRQLREENVPVMVAAPIVWVACEWIRNYLMTGISVCMLGHSLANFPLLIQVADLGGTYLVSAIIVVVNAGIWLAIRPPAAGEKRPLSPIAIAVVVMVLTLGYGVHRLGQQAVVGKTQFALLDLDLQTEYDQDQARSNKLFQDYVRASIDVVAKSDNQIDALVWPESMFGGELAWMVAADGLQVPAAVELTVPEFRSSIEQYRAAYDQRNMDLHNLLRRGSDRAPELIVGGPVMRYSDRTEIFSGLVHIDQEREVDWYGKNHLVMFGEYVPVLSTWSVFRSFVPDGLGLARSDQPVAFDVDGLHVMANICIETAVERIAVNHMCELQHSANLSPDVIVTVTNDAWFDHTSVVEHHLRCAQLLAVGCRRPILSAGNGGPTAWIDSHGRVVDRIPSGGSGHILATPAIDRRHSLYVQVGSSPAGMTTLLLVGLLWRSQQKKRARQDLAR